MTDPIDTPRPCPSCGRMFKPMIDPTYAAKDGRLCCSKPCQTLADPYRKMHECYEHRVVDCWRCGLAAFLSVAFALAMVAGLFVVGKLAWEASR